LWEFAFWTVSTPIGEHVCDISLGERVCDISRP